MATDVHAVAFDTAEDGDHAGQGDDDGADVDIVCGGLGANEGAEPRRIKTTQIRDPLVRRHAEDIAAVQLLKRLPYRLIPTLVHGVNVGGDGWPDPPPHEAEEAVQVLDAVLVRRRRDHECGAVDEPIDSVGLQARLVLDAMSFVDDLEREEVGVDLERVAFNNLFPEILLSVRIVLAVRVVTARICVLALRPLLLVQHSLLEQLLLEALHSREDDGAARLRIVWVESVSPLLEAFGLALDRSLLLHGRCLCVTEGAEGLEGDVALTAGSSEAEGMVVEPRRESGRRAYNDGRTMNGLLTERLDGIAQFVL